MTAKKSVCSKKKLWYDTGRYCNYFLHVNSINMKNELKVTVADCYMKTNIMYIHRNDSKLCWFV
jgi:hypothetical protein